ncbi:MAG: flippase-like domain-containing protein [Deltaproteobacteria bacterium]|nr:flippase-like domain-containing protein [Deltaproteobacteria bacterium]
MTEEKPQTGRRWVDVARWVGFALCAGLFVRTLAQADLASAWTRIQAIGPVVLVCLLPFPVALFMDAWAWHGLLRAIGRKTRLGLLFRLRFAIEAVTNSAPVGPLWADALAPILLTRHTDVPAADAFATIVAKRWVVVRMHATYVALTGAFGATAILRASQVLLHNDSLLVGVFTAALFLAVLAIVFQLLVSKGGLGGRISARLAKWKRISSWVESRRHHFSRADTQLAKLSADHWVNATASWRMLGLWFFEGLETWVILKLLGVQLTVVEVLSFDAALSVVRSIAMFGAPSGIGVQDVGYLAVLRAYGVADADTVGPAFVVLKRIKEALWMAVGFVILARSGPRALAEARLAVKVEEEELAREAKRLARPSQDPQPPSAAT